MNQFYTQTTLPTPNINYQTVWPNDPTDTSDTIPRWVEYDLSNLLWSDDIINQLASENLIPQLVRIFRWSPNRFFPWHIDGTIDEITTFAINWVLDGSGTIQWSSKLKLPLPPKEHYHLAYGNMVGSLTDEYEESALGHGCLVNTTIPHRVVNNNDIHRITVSIQFGNQYTYEEVREKLSALGFIA